MLILIFILLLMLLSSKQIKYINNFLKKIKNIQNIILLAFSIFSFVAITKSSIKHTNNKKRTVNSSVKKFIASNQKWKCKNCNNILDHTYEIDHIEPLFKGGSNTNENLQALCRNCHGKKTFNDLQF